MDRLLPVLQNTCRCGDPLDGKGAKAWSPDEVFVLVLLLVLETRPMRTRKRRTRKREKKLVASAGVDLVNTDDLPGLAKFLREAR